MSSLLSSVHLALRAMLSQQEVIQVTEHNVANASTPGYRRQEAVLKAAPSYNTVGMNMRMGVGLLGAGVGVEQIARYNTDFFDRRFRSETADSKRWEQQSQLLSQIETSLAETSGSGVLPALDQFWTGWHALAGDPTNSSLRAELVDRSLALTRALSSRDANLLSMQQDQNVAITARVDEINNIATQIATLNKQISTAMAPGNSPNDLMDQRDQLLDRLAEIAGVVSFRQPNGEVLVSLGGHSLVTGQSTNKLTAVTTNNLVNVHWVEANNTTQPAMINTGELAGMLKVRDESIPSLRAGLDLLAQTLVNQVNAVHTAGFGINGAGGQAFFTGNSAGTIAVNANLISNPGLIATAAAANQPGDGSVARSIANLQLGTQAALNGLGFNQFYNGQVTSMALNTKQAAFNASERMRMAKGTESMRESLSGVNLNEEAASMVKAQKAYEAAARVMTAIDEMMDTIINRMGLVGR